MKMDVHAVPLPAPSLQEHFRMYCSIIITITLLNHNRKTDTEAQNSVSCLVTAVP